MSAIAERPVVFGEWTGWALRRSLRSSQNKGGVYLLAHCRTGTAPAIAAPDSLPFEVVYVGNTKNLNARPVTGSHTGLKQYHAKIDQKDERLFVAVAELYETGCADYASERIYSEYVESMLIWNYTRQHNHPPALHYGHKGQYPEEVAALVCALKGRRK